MAESLPLHWTFSRRLSVLRFVYHDFCRWRLWYTDCCFGSYCQMFFFFTWSICYFRRYSGDCYIFYKREKLCNSESHCIYKTADVDHKTDEKLRVELGPSQLTSKFVNIYDTMCKKLILQWCICRIIRRAEIKNIWD